VTWPSNADYTHLTPCSPPRAALLTFNRKDDSLFRRRPRAGNRCLTRPSQFTSSTAKRKTCAPTSMRIQVRTISCSTIARRLYRVLGDFLLRGDKSYDAKEIESKDELKTGNRSGGRTGRRRTWISTSWRWPSSPTAAQRRLADEKTAQKWQTGQRENCGTSSRPRSSRSSNQTRGDEKGGRSKRATGVYGSAARGRSHWSSWPRVSRRERRSCSTTPVAKPPRQRERLLKRGRGCWPSICSTSASRKSRSAISVRAAHGLDRRPAARHSSSQLVALASGVPRKFKSGPVIRSVAVGPRLSVIPSSRGDGGQAIGALELHESPAA